MIPCQVRSPNGCPICGVQCARPAPYVSVILKFALKGKSSVSTQDPKKNRPWGAWISSLIHILFCLLVLELKIIFSLTKDKVCVFFRIVMSVLVVGAVACALNKSLAAFGGRGPKDHLLINPLPHPVFSLFIHTVMDIRCTLSILTNVSFRENEILTFVRFRHFF